MELITAKESIILNEDGPNVITSEQILGKDFWEDLDEAKENFSFRLNGLTPVASVPVSVANKWLREGFDIWSASSREIQQKLRADGYDTFIVSGNKTF